MTGEQLIYAIISLVAGVFVVQQTIVFIGELRRDRAARARLRR